MSIQAELNFLQSFRDHQSKSNETLKKLNDTYLHEKVYITLSCPEIYKRKKTLGVITDIGKTLGKYYRFTIVTEQGRELIIRHDITSDKAMTQGALMDCKIEKV